MREVPIQTQTVIWSTGNDSPQDFIECLNFCAAYVAEYRSVIKVYYSKHDRTYKAVPGHMDELIKKDGFDLRVTFWKPL